MSVANNEKVEPRQYRRRRVDSPSGPRDDSITEQPEPGRRRLGTPPDHPFTPREAWLLSRSLAGIGGDDDGGTPNMDVADLLHTLSVLSLADRSGVFRSWLAGRPDAAKIRRLVADVDPVGPEPDEVDEPEAEADAPGEEADGDCDPFGPDAARAARQSVRLSDFEIGVADETLEVLTADSTDLYQKDGALVRVNRTPKEGSTVASIHKMSEANLREEITHRVHFFTESLEPVEGEEKKTRKVRKTQKCPNYLPKAIAGRGEYPGVRPLDRIVTAPVFRSDGSIVSRPGYDDSAWLFYEPDAEYPPIPEAPTRANAQTALREIMDLVTEFPWTGERDKAVWLTGLLTMIGRELFAGPAPLFALDGNQRGVGKGLATDVAAIIATGRRAPSGISMRGRDDDDELRKVIDSVAMANAAGMLLFDNLSGPIGGAILDSAITSSRRAGRKLGGNETFDVESKITYWANGNNLSTTGDSSRRALIAKMAYTASDRAAEGRDFAIPDLVGHVEANRPRLYIAAMTILRAHVVAGAPKSAKTLGSFEQWSWTIASAVAWITGIDPIGAVAYNVIDDPADEINAAILAGLYDMLASKGELRRGVKAATIIERAKPGVSGRSNHPDLADALAEVATGARDLPNGRVLARKLRTIVDQPIGGLILRKAGVDRMGIVLWTVERVDAESVSGEGVVDTIPFATAHPNRSSSNGSTAGEAAR